MKHLSFFLALSIFTFINNISAQEILGNIDINDPNQTHTLTTKTGDRLVGKITQLSDTELTLEYKGNKLKFKRSEVIKIEVQFQENEGNSTEPSSDIEILGNLSDLPKEETEPTPSPTPKYPFEVVGPLDLENKKQKHKVFVNDGNIFVGRIKMLTDKKLTIRIDQKTILSFDPNTILVVEVVGFKEPEIDFTENDKPQFTNRDTTKWYILETKRGDRFVGKVVEYGKDDIVFELENKSILNFKNDEVNQIFRQDSAPKSAVGLVIEPEEIEMNGAQNLFLSPTGFNYGRGQTEYKNLEVFYNSIDHGLTDNFSLGFGIIPFFVANVIDLKSKLTFDIGDYFHVGAGAHLLAGFTVGQFSGDNWSLGAVHANVSVGTEEKFINFGYGKWLPINDDFNNIRSDLFMLGGSFRVGEKGRVFGDLIRVVEDGEFEFSQSDYTMVMLGGSWFNNKNRVDFGLFMIPNAGTDVNQTIVFPMAGYARKF